MDMRIHWVKTIDITEIKPIGDDHHYRKINVKTDKDQEFELVLFADEFDRLVIQ